MADGTKWALVTGAGSGIGRATAIALSKAGFRLILTGRREELLNETNHLLEENGLVDSVDVSNPDSVKSLFEKIRSEAGRLDVVFNNAGIAAPSARLDEVESDDWEKVIAINLTGVFLCTREAFRLMKEQSPQGGRIINNGSIAATTPRPNSIAYTASKHGVTGITKATSLEGRPFNIACGQIDIGNALTEMAHGVTEGALQPTGKIEVEPTMSVENVANAVVHMASLPLDANILRLSVMANGMPFVGRG